MAFWNLLECWRIDLLLQYNYVLFQAPIESIYFHLLKLIFHIMFWSRYNWIYNRIIELIIFFEFVVMAKCNFKSCNAHQHAEKSGFLCVIFAINDVKSHRNETSWYWFLPKDTLHLYYRASVSMSHIIKGSHTVAAFFPLN